MSDWNDSTKFRMETGRTIIFALLAFLGVGLFERPWQQSQAYQAEVAKTKLQIKASVLQEFLNTSYAYTSITADVLRPNVQKDTIERYQGDVYDRYQSSKNQLALYFPMLEVTNALNGASIISSNLHGYFHNSYYERKAVPTNAETLRIELKKQNLAAAKAAFDALEINKINGQLRPMVFAFGCFFIMLALAYFVFWKMQSWADKPKGERPGTQPTADKLPGSQS